MINQRRSYFFPSKQRPLRTKQALFDCLARLFQCSRIVIAAEPTRSILFNALLELYPEGVLWTDEFRCANENGFDFRFDDACSVA